MYHGIGHMVTGGSWSSPGGGWPGLGGSRWSGTGVGDDIPPPDQDKHPRPGHPPKTAPSHMTESAPPQGSTLPGKYHLPQGCTTPRTAPPPRTSPPPGEHSPTPRTAPPTLPPLIPSDPHIRELRSICGRLASYWNAILFLHKLESLPPTNEIAGR